MKMRKEIEVLSGLTLDQFGIWWAPRDRRDGKWPCPKYVTTLYLIEDGAEVECVDAWTIGKPFAKFIPVPFYNDTVPSYLERDELAEKYSKKYVICAVEQRTYTSDSRHDENVMLHVALSDKPFTGVLSDSEANPGDPKTYVVISTMEEESDEQ